jgi:hypothetical protein
LAAALAAPRPRGGRGEGVTAPARDWSKRVEATAEGGYRMGNPDAR